MPTPYDDMQESAINAARHLAEATRRGRPPVGPRVVDGPGTCRVEQRSGQKAPLETTLQPDTAGRAVVLTTCILIVPSGIDERAAQWL